MGRIKTNVQLGCIAVACLFLIGNGCKQHTSAHFIIPTRIISLAPSITETLFALGCGNRVVGVTGYCVYPPEALKKERIGGFTDANLEKIVALRPDLVLLLPEHSKQRQFLEQFGIHVVTVKNGTVAEICTTFATIGQECKVTPAADSLIALFAMHFKNDQIGATGNLPKILFCVGREAPGSGKVAGVFAAGVATFYNDVIRAAGGQNALNLAGAAFPRLSTEGVIATAPDIVIDIASAMENTVCSQLINDWQSCGNLPAVVDRQVYCMASSYCTVPGPRLVLLVDDIKKIVSQYRDVKARQ